MNTRFALAIAETWQSYFQMLAPGRMLVAGLVLGMLLGVFVLVTMRINPRLWLQDFPADIQALVPPKTRAEQRQTIIWGIPLVALFVGIPLASTWLLKDQHGGELPFFVACGHAYGVFVVANLFDLLVIDWLGFALTDPQRPPFLGTEGAAGGSPAKVVMLLAAYGFERKKHHSAIQDYQLHLLD